MFNTYGEGLKILSHQCPNKCPSDFSMDPCNDI